MRSVCVCGGGVTIFDQRTARPPAEKINARAARQSKYKSRTNCAMRGHESHTGATSSPAQIILFGAVPLICDCCIYLYQSASCLSDCLYICAMRGARSRSTSRDVHGPHVTGNQGKRRATYSSQSNK